MSLVTGGLGSAGGLVVSQGLGGTTPKPDARDACVLIAVHPDAEIVSTVLADADVSLQIRLDAEFIIISSDDPEFTLPVGLDADLTIDLQESC